VDGGTGVLIFGRNIDNVVSVTFAGAPATDVFEVTPGVLFATTPPHAATRANVIVTTTSGSDRLRRAYASEAHATATTLTSSLDPSALGQNVTFTARVRADSGIPASGQVTFMDGTQTLGTFNLTNGRARFSTTALAAGRHRIKALFPRNGMFSASRDSLSQRVK